MFVPANLWWHWPLPLQKKDPTGSGIGDGAQFGQSLEPQDTKGEEKETGETPLKLPVQTTDVDEQLSCKEDFHQHDSEPVGEKVSGFLFFLLLLFFFVPWFVFLATGNWLLRRYMNKTRAKSKKGKEKRKTL